jgi:hypothetical protein
MNVQTAPRRSEPRKRYLAEADFEPAAVSDEIVRLNFAPFFPFGP